jgi:hypothetical protein
VNTPDRINIANRETAARIASSFGLDEQKTAAALASLTEELKARIERTMLSRGGVADVVALVTGGPRTAEQNSQPLNDPDVAARGNQILDKLIGSKHTSRGIAQSTAKNSGLPASTVEQLLPVVASFVIGELQKRAGPAIARAVNGMPGLSASDGGARAPQRAASPGPDYGNPLPVPGDNIPGVGERGQSRTRGRWPQDDPRGQDYPGPDDRGGPGGPDEEPGPEDNPYSRLPDIIRRGGGRVPGTNGGSLEDTIRDILGNVLGSNSGVVGTMIKLFLVRWLAQLVRRVLGGVFARR